MTDKEIEKNYIECSSCDHILDCKERGKHGMCINYEPIKRGGDKSGRQRLDKTT